MPRTVTPRLRGLILLAVLVAAAVGLTVALTGGGKRKLVPAAGNAHGTYDPLAYHRGSDAALARAAAAGEGHIVFAKSPGGVLATAKRTAHFRPLVEAAARKGGVDPNLLEAIVFLESAGRPDVIAGSDPQNASGLTQILAETGQNLLGMHVDLAASRRITRRMARARSTRALRHFEAQRRRADDRFDPRKALAATVRYLTIARRHFGRDDLAATSYHMGIGNLSNVLSDYGGKPGRIGYARLYFDSSPLRHARAWGLLARFGDDSSNYYWKLLAAEQIMRLYRSDPSELRRLAGLHAARASAEEVLHPPGSAPIFATADAIKQAEARRQLVRIPGDSKRYGFAIDPLLGQFAGRLGQRPVVYRALRPEALGLLTYLAAGVQAIAPKSSPLSVTSGVRDVRYQHLVAAANIEATHGYSLHTTGFTFDVRRRYSSHAEAEAFQFMLDRLQAMNLIAWVREPDAIHITVSSRARVLEPLIGR
ncbi:MAG: transglycosylase SLT domain-containing protein [Thermoleophilaceae bacterium]